MTATQARENATKALEVSATDKKAHILKRYDHIFKKIQTASLTGRTQLVLGPIPTYAYDDDEFVPAMQFMGYGVKHIVKGMDETFVISW